MIASHDIREDDDELGGADNSLYLHLLHHSTLSLKISGLSTGYSKDVHGEVWTGVQYNDYYVTTYIR